MPRRRLCLNSGWLLALLMLGCSPGDDGAVIDDLPLYEAAVDSTGPDGGVPGDIDRGDGTAEETIGPADGTIGPADGTIGPTDGTIGSDSSTDEGSPIDMGGVVPPIEAGNPGPTVNPCRTLTPTITGDPAHPMIHGTSGRDIIFAFNGEYTIEGGDGDDVICTGAGDDTVSGGAGDDYIDTGLGNDTVHGDAGRDIIHGRGGSDHLFGGDGNDVIFGDLLDDDLFGEDGDDVLIGSHGTDYLHGGAGNDWLRGDTGHDTFVGGDGIDTVSFMTAAPPLGGGLAAGDEAFDGVVVDLNAHLTADDGATQELRDHDAGDLVADAGVATGDGYREAIVGVEVIVGSAFNDRLAGVAGTTRLVGGYGDDSLSGPSGVVLDDGPGTDTCRGAPCDNSGEAPPRPTNPFVFVDDSGDDLGLIVLGSQGVVNDTLSVDMVGTSLYVTGPAGSTFTAGPHCIIPVVAAPNTVQCGLPHAFRYVLGFGGDGNDNIELVGDFPRDHNAHLYGGNGDDTLVGGNGDEVLFTGPTGTDTLRGNGGDDALLSESASNVQTTHGVDYHDGADTLDGGGGNDQLVADYPCGGHHFIGGDGVDIAGFRRSSPAGLSSYQGITAQFGGFFNDPSHQQAFHGRAFMPGLCPFDPYGTTLAGDLEVLEAGEGDDHLYGNDVANTIWAWGGDDHIWGYGGDDVLDGNQGADEIFGGDGRDRLHGYDGNDTLHAREPSGAADYEINCGGGGGTLADRDPSDPPAIMCR